MSAAAAEYHVLETYDILRSTVGHDYGGGRRTMELNRRLHELDLEELRQVRAQDFTHDEIVAAWRKVAVPRVRRVELESFRRHTPATKRTVDSWRRARRRLGVGGAVAA